MMKTLKDFEEEIYKCSRCGLCQSVCPVYKASLNECAVSKAKFNMLNGVLKGDLILNKNIKKYADLCTGCNACKEFCPSSIDAREIFTAVKSQYYSENKVSLLEKITDSYCFFKFLLRMASIVFFFYRLLRLEKLCSCFYKILPNKLLLLDSLIKTKVGKIGLSPPKNEKVLYFAGCFNKYLNPSSKNAVLKIFKDFNIDVTEKDFECCGISYLNEGKINEFTKLAKNNIEQLSDNYDCLLTDCASCSYALREYKNYLSSDKADELAVKTMNILEFLKDKKLRAVLPVTVTAHKPCHEDFDFISILKKIKNVTYVESEDYDKCCGFSGKFALKYPEISKRISEKKAQKFLDTQAEIIITTCPACVLGINQGLIENKNNDSAQNVQVMNLIEFIAEYCRPAI